MEINMFRSVNSYRHSSPADVCKQYSVKNRAHQILVYLVPVLIFSMLIALIPSHRVFAAKNKKTAVMKSNGITFDLTTPPSKWITFHTYLPYYDTNLGQVELYNQKLQCKITKYSDVLNSSTGSSSRGSSTTSEPTRTVTVTFNVQIPTKNANNLSSGIKARDLFDRDQKAYNVISYLNTLGDNITDYFNIVVTDYKTGENLLTTETSASSGNEGENYQNVKTTLTKWTPVGSGNDKDQRLHRTNAGDYYEEYFAVLKVTAPASYDRMCIGVNGIKKAVARRGASYITAYNQGYTLGYGSYIDSSYYVKGDKLISTFMRVKKKKVPANTRTR